MVLKAPGMIDQAVIWSNYNFVKIVKILFDCMHLGYKKLAVKLALGRQRSLSFHSGSTVIFIAERN